MEISGDSWKCMEILSRFLYALFESLDPLNVTCHTSAKWDTNIPKKSPR